MIRSAFLHHHLPCPFTARHSIPINRFETRSRRRRATPRSGSHTQAGRQPSRQPVRSIDRRAFGTEGEAAAEEEAREAIMAGSHCLRGDLARRLRDPRVDPRSFGRGLVMQANRRSCKARRDDSTEVHTSPPTHAQTRNPNPPRLDRRYPPSDPLRHPLHPAFHPDCLLDRLCRRGRGLIRVEEGMEAVGPKCVDDRVWMTHRYHSLLHDSLTRSEGSSGHFGRDRSRDATCNDGGRLGDSSDLRCILSVG